MSKKEALKEQLKAALLEANTIAKAAEDADRDFTDDERATVMAKMAEARDLKAKMDQADGDAAAMKAIAELGDGIGIGLNEKGEKQTPNGLIVPDGRKSIGQHYVDSPEYKALLGTVPGGVFSKDHRVQSRPVGYQHLTGGAKALVTGLSDTSAGAFVQNDFRGLKVGEDIFQRPLTLRNLVTSGTTTSDTVEYVKVTGFTNNAAPVAEATSSAAPTAPSSVPGALVLNAGGGYKPESSISTGRATAIVKTIAHWIPVTKRALSDAAQMRTLIDNFLEYGLEEELEDQMIAGDGTGENFTGIANTSGVQTQAFVTDLFTTTRKAKTKVRLVGRSIANGWLFNPADLETLDLIQDNEGRYYSGGPYGSFGANQGLWNVPIIETEAVPQGTAYIGDWRKAILWDREQATITTTDSHADFFIRNLVAILAEMRAAFGILQPNAFVKVTLA